MKERVAVLLSGGIDSCFSLYLLFKKGYELIGITFRNGYVSSSDIMSARYICENLGIPHYVVDLHKEFREEVIEYFISSYLKGVTPNPCVVCNRYIKFGKLVEYAQSLGCRFVATGHYAKILNKNGEVILSRGKSIFKSQEYFLSWIPKKVLKKVILPLGDYTKKEVIEKVKEEKIYPFSLRESRDICFVKDDYREFIQSYLKDKHSFGGKIKNMEGEILGEHQGFYFYTYGQREGLGISKGKPLYVRDINPHTKEVVVAEREKVLKDVFVVKNLNWFYPPSDYKNLRVKLRYNSYPLPCSIKIVEDFLVCKLEEKDIPTPGQLAVFYDKDKVVVAGFIAKR